VKGSSEARSVFRKLSNATDHFLNLSVEYLGYVPCDNSVPEAVKKQHLLADIFPSSKAARCLVSIAKKLCRERPGPYESGTMKFFSKAIVDRDGK
ncbi:MAG: flagellar synthesis regulator FleN, partial [Deltaproteobacteria bacterium]|nr:flagellar synthesis regulator FleN [Deltaproteobacteria bacterium]